MKKRATDEIGALLRRCTTLAREGHSVRIALRLEIDIDPGGSDDDETPYVIGAGYSVEDEEEEEERPAPDRAAPDRPAPKRPAPADTAADGTTFLAADLCARYLRTCMVSGALDWYGPISLRYLSGSDEKIDMETLRQMQKEARHQVTAHVHATMSTGILASVTSNPQKTEYKPLPYLFSVAEEVVMDEVRQQGPRALLTTYNTASLDQGSLEHAVNVAVDTLYRITASWEHALLLLAEGPPDALAEAPPDDDKSNDTWETNVRMIATYPQNPRELAASFVSTLSVIYGATSIPQAWIEEVQPWATPGGPWAVREEGS